MHTTDIECSCRMHIEWIKTSYIDIATHVHIASYVNSSVPVWNGIPRDESILLQ